ncbi:hypothetical protein CBD41_04210 [bacterium TMED181]|nr:hypothetical protein [Planctomycetota bacterium]OUW45279.1 MAG: hypothetical protein CBD41_04210 [bacterium TMED181]
MDAMKHTSCYFFGQRAEFSPIHWGALQSSLACGIGGISPESEPTSGTDRGSSRVLRAGEG